MDWFQQTRGKIAVIVGFVIAVCAMSFGQQFPVLGLHQHLLLAGGVALPHG